MRMKLENVFVVSGDKILGGKSTRHYAGLFLFLQNFTYLFSSLGPHQPAGQGAEAPELRGRGSGQPGAHPGGDGERRRTHRSRPLRQGSDQVSVVFVCRTSQESSPYHLNISIWKYYKEETIDFLLVKACAVLKRYQICTWSTRRGQSSQAWTTHYYITNVIIFLTNV